MHWAADIRSNDPDRSIVLGWTVVIKRRRQRRAGSGVAGAGRCGRWRLAASGGGDSGGRAVERGERREADGSGDGGDDGRPGSIDPSLVDDEKMATASFGRFDGWMKL
ncbi:hypothetical protein ACLOJK_023600 [Asimina triloba]